MKKILLLLLLISLFGNAQQKIKLSTMDFAPTGSTYVVATNSLTGQQTYSLATSLGLLPSTTSLTINGVVKSLFGSPNYTVGLQDAINQSPTVNGVLAQSPSGKDYYEIRDGLIDGKSVNPIDANEFSTFEASPDYTQLYSYNNGTISQISSSSLTENLIKHDVQNTFNAPFNIFYGTSVMPNMPASKLMYINHANNITPLYLGSGLSLSEGSTTGTLTATGTASTTTITQGSNITVTGTAPNYTISSPSQSLSISGNTISLSASGGSVTIPTQTTGLQSALTASTNITINSNTISATTPTLNVVGGTLSGSYPTQTLTIPTSSTTILTGSTNITVSGTAPNYTISTPTQTTALSSSLTTLQGSVTANNSSISTLSTNVTANTSSITTLQSSKQNTLVAGTNITISTNTISVSSSPTFTNTTLTGTTTISGQVNETYTTTASSSTVNLATINANYIHITGTTTINSFGTVQAGAERTLVFDGSTSITSNTASIILPNSLSISTSTNDVMVIRSEGSGVWRMVTYQRYADSWTTYSPTVTGFSVVPTGFAARYVLNGKTCTVSFSSTGNGASNATTITMTLPFVAAGLDVSALTFCLDNAATTVGTAITTAGSNVVSIFKNGSSSWTATGSKRFNGMLVYEIQ